ncbi:hypothetical protein Thiowin_02188 [Thiorhodovibrio winogradskyi]|uniref:GTP-binding protein n=1 Tax=Thiorhodovibrio winogradskyi TaxID=77007 RepID=A0ABZ0S8E7_9GAMM|nr:DUF4143 domain-containing protein [Thiorhodovibrio winogradskyi]
MQIGDDITNLQGMYHPRLQTDRLRLLARSFPVVIVGGARQVGKTTLLRHCFPDIDYVVFDPSLDIENARAEPDLFLRNHPPPAILDEIQYAPELAGAIKRHVDRQPDLCGQHLLTGSQQWQMLRELTESLAGRAAFLDLHGFSLLEITDTQGAWLPRWLERRNDFLAEARAGARYPGALTEWLWRGTLPRARVIESAAIPDFWLGYHRTYVERDLRLQGEVEDWQQFGRFIGLMSALTAQEINYSQLGREIGLAGQSARRWLAMMTATYQWTEIPAYSGNATKRVSGRPKGYIADTGLACHHARLSTPKALPSHPLFGALFETAMAAEMLKQAATLPARPACFHWRSAGGAEVDLILEHDDWLYPFAFKLTAAPTRRMASGINAFRRAYPRATIATGALLCAVEEPRWIAENVMALPWNLLRVGD